MKRCKGSNLLSLVRLPTTKVPSTTTIKPVATTTAEALSTSRASLSTTTAESDNEELQEFRICIDMHSKFNVDKDVVVLKINSDTQETTSQPVLKKTGPNTKTTCPTILAKNEPYFKIMTTGIAVSTVLIHHSNKVGCVFPVVICSE